MTNTTKARVLKSKDELLKSILSNDDRLRFKDTAATYDDGTPLIRDGKLKMIRVPRYTMANVFIDAAIKEAKND